MFFISNASAFPHSALGILPRRFRIVSWEVVLECDVLIVGRWAARWMFPAAISRYGSGYVIEAFGDGSAGRCSPMALLGKVESYVTRKPN